MQNPLARLDDSSEQHSRGYMAREIVRAQISVPRSLRAALDRMVENEVPVGTLKVEIVLKERDLIVQQMASYLALIDRIYGRLTYGSLERYRRTRNDNLAIAEVRRGSVIFVLRDSASALFSPYGLILTALALRYLPNLIRAPASAYRDYQQGRLLRAERQRLIDRAGSDALLQKFDKKDTSQLTSVLSRIYELEQHRLASARSFAVRSILEVRIESRED